MVHSKARDFEACSRKPSSVCACGTHIVKKASLPPPSHLRTAKKIAP